MIRPVEVLLISIGVWVLADVSRLVRRLRVDTVGLELDSVLVEVEAGVVASGVELVELAVTEAGVVASGVELVELAVTEAGVVASGVEPVVLVAGAGVVATLAGDTATG